MKFALEIRHIWLKDIKPWRDNPRDICYEPFCGSGSQIIAAERLNRRCFAIELEPIFVDVSVRRWEDFTGRKAKRITKSKGTARN